MRHAPCSISNRLRKESLNKRKQLEQQQSQDDTTFNSFYMQKSVSNENDLSVSKQTNSEQSATVNLNNHISNFLTSLTSLMSKQIESQENDPKTEKIFTIKSLKDKEDNKINKLPFKINTNNEYYDYDDILTYFKSPQSNAVPNTDAQTKLKKLNKLRLIENNSCNDKFLNQSQDKFEHILYDTQKMFYFYYYLLNF